MPKRRPGVSADRSPDAWPEIPRSAGRALDPGVRRLVEGRTGWDLQAVRVHTDPVAAASAARLGAYAYTVGNDVYFDHGQYDPTRPDGLRLLAHELTHVVQQAAVRAGPPGLQRQRRSPPACSNQCAAGGCPQGRQAKVVTDDCQEGEPADQSSYIQLLEVSLSGRTVTATWTGGNTETWPCSPNPSVTPTGSDRVGLKCGVDHTNHNKDGMAWFTGFRKTYKRIGFHDSQPVGPGCVSHGCVRVCCDVAQTINRNTWSGKTRINVT